MIRQAKVAWLAVGMMMVILAAGCTAPPPPTPGLVRVSPPTVAPLPSPVTIDPTAADALAVVAAEAEAVRQQDIDALAQLWASDGELIDAAHTPDDRSDDRRWEGWPAIQERYTREVFPYYTEPDLSPRPRQSRPWVDVRGEEAEVTVPGSDGRTIQDRWLLERVDGAWRIVRLEYNLAPQGPSETGG